MSTPNYTPPKSLNPFQAEMYAHLVGWKEKNITPLSGRTRSKENKAMIPESLQDDWLHIYPEVHNELKSHIAIPKFSFDLHLYFHHMASSQAANINLFLPILLSDKADEVLMGLKPGVRPPDLKNIARSQLYRGFQIEYWDEERNLRDKNKSTGTDSDIAIAYYNHDDELCLWLIEHKLTENEFTRCGGYKSKGKTDAHDCSKSFSELLKDKPSCYYHSKCGYKYWDITEQHQDFFAGHEVDSPCPFKGGMNQLWRNQLMGLAIEQDDQQPYKHVTFSVVKHPKNIHLDKTLGKYKELIAGNPKFTTFDSVDVVKAAESLKDEELSKWSQWYRGLYNLN